MKLPYYTYIFVRQDISWEQQLVQSSHVAMELGNRLPTVKDIYFTIIGIPNMMEMSRTMQLLNSMKVRFERFYEPDMGGILTAIATYPIRKDRRGPLLNYKLLRFK